MISGSAVDAQPRPAGAPRVHLGIRRHCRRFTAAIIDDEKMPETFGGTTRRQSTSLAGASYRRRQRHLGPDPPRPVVRLLYFQPNPSSGSCTRP